MFGSVTSLCVCSLRDQPRTWAEFMIRFWGLSTLNLPPFQNFTPNFPPAPPAPHFVIWHFKLPWAVSGLGSSPGCFRPKAAKLQISRTRLLDFQGLTSLPFLPAFHHAQEHTYCCLFNSFQSVNPYYIYSFRFFFLSICQGKNWQGEGWLILVISSSPVLFPWQYEYHGQKASLCSFIIIFSKLYLPRIHITSGGFCS